MNHNYPRKTSHTSDISTSTRFRLIGIAFVIGTILALGRLFYWQVIASDRLVQAATRQHWSSQIIQAPRGLIKSRDGTTIAGSQLGYSVFFDRKQAKDLNISNTSSTLGQYTVTNPLPPELAWQDSQDATSESEIEPLFSPTPTPSIYLLDAEISRLNQLLSNTNSSWVELSPYISQTQKELIVDQKLPGLVFLPKTTRVYPAVSQFPHVLGIVGKNSQGFPMGYFGLEGFYNRDLSGEQGRVSKETDASGNPIAIGQSRSVNSIQGRSLITNLDRTVQYILEKELKDGLETYMAVAGTATVMDPKTGAIIAMVSIPQYQPNWYKDYPSEAYSNPVVAQSYEPGSIFKPLIMVSAIDKKVVDDTTICPCNGPVAIGPEVIRNWDSSYHPNSTLTDIIKNSDNVGMVFVGRQLGQDNLISTLNDFGIGTKTGIDLQEEMTPNLRSDDDWREIDLATATFGQGIAVTPIQMLTAMGAIANGGILMQPQVVKQIDDNGNIIPIEPRPIRQVVSPQSADHMKQIMTTAFEFFITNHGRKDLDGYRIAGKTGTAQIPIKGHYDKDKVIASFIGFAPAEDPKFIMLVTLREPKSGNFASQTAAPLWFSIAKQLFSYWGIQPK